MNKYQLYTLGGAMLAASSLSSAAFATTVGTYTGTTFTAGAVKIDDLLFSPTAATANAIVFGNPAAIGAGTGAVPGISFTNTYSAGITNANPFKITIPASGATFTNITQTSVAFIVSTDGGHSAVLNLASLNAGTVGGVVPTVSSLGGTLIVSNVALSSNTGAGVTLGGNAGISSLGANLVGIEITGDVFTNASQLATNGSVAIGLTVQDSTGFSYESIAPAAVITGATPISASISTGTSLAANANATVPYSLFVGGSQTLVLATVSVTSNGTLGTDLTTKIDADGNAGAGVASSISIALAGVTALGDTTAAPTIVISDEKGDHVLTALATSPASGAYTPSAYTSGTVTFTISAASGFESTLGISLSYSGTTAISAATAGTVSVSFTANAVQAVTAPSGVGATPTAAITRSGLTTQADWATDAASGLPSYLRIHNTGGSAGVASIVVKQDATTVGGTITTLGTYPSSTVPAGGTIQVGVPTIEAALGITPSANNTYTLIITAPFTGYVQHLQLTPSNTLLDLDGFRAGGGSAP